MYIRIRNWERFQHYKNRRPVWLKLYTELMSDDAWRELSAARRGLLTCLWLEYGLSRTCLRLDVHLLNSRMGLAAKMSDYVALNHAGFIDFVARPPLDDVYQPAIADVDKEKEKESLKDQPNTANGTGSDDIDWKIDPIPILESVRPAERKGTS